ncbi:unnamed protein product [Gongylonema pulchrum]|uniref:Uncharacterized protein n=1 Tax=Gongylonema pulchrum TaxID=637853 RepID=A0A183CUV5_9BILA|nr:unnamed protein product [Gongylonema pulchrum]
MNVEHSWLAKVCKFQASKHEGYLDEEKEMINRGLKNAKKLVGWYNERLRSLQKRANLLARGLVAVDSAVHEQKLNYLRAHIAELNRRITSLLESSERGFPSYSNLQVPLSPFWRAGVRVGWISWTTARAKRLMTEKLGTAILDITAPLRNRRTHNVRTQMPQPSDDRTQYYQRQNIKLCQVILMLNAIFPCFCTKLLS